MDLCRGACWEKRKSYVAGAESKAEVVKRKEVVDEVTQ